VDFPVPRGPKRKKLESEALKKRGINSILRLKVEFTMPFYQLKEREASKKRDKAPNPAFPASRFSARLKEKPQVFTVAKLCQKASKRAITDRKYRKG
jgi:hypothetical protein